MSFPGVGFASAGGGGGPPGPGSITPDMLAAGTFPGQLLVTDASNNFQLGPDPAGFGGPNPVYHLAGDGLALDRPVLQLSTALGQTANIFEIRDVATGSTLTSSVDYLGQYSINSLATNPTSMIPLQVLVNCAPVGTAETNIGTLINATMSGTPGAGSRVQGLNVYVSENGLGTDPISLTGISTSINFRSLPADGTGLAVSLATDTTSIVTQATGVSSTMNLTGTVGYATLANLSATINGATANITSVTGLSISVSLVNGAAVASSYLIFLETSGTPVDQWAIWQSTPEDKNYFAGFVGVGSSTITDSEKFKVTGKTLLNGDLQLYGSGGSTGNVLDHYGTTRIKVEVDSGNAIRFYDSNPTQRIAIESGGGNPITLYDSTGVAVLTITDGNADVAGTFTINGSPLSSLTGTTQSGTPFLTVVGVTGANSATGVSNTVMGFQALDSLTSGQWNTVVGYRAGSSASAGSSFGLVAIGYLAGAGQTHFGGGNTLVGTEVAQTASSNSNRTFIGFRAGQFNTGANNTCVGRDADQFSSGNDNTVLGYSSAQALSSGSNNVYIGSSVQSSSATSHDAVGIGKSAVAANDSVVIGASASGSGIVAVIAIGRAAIAESNNTATFGSSGFAMNRVFFGKGMTNASPTVYSIEGTGGSGADVAGADIALGGGCGTGTALGGNLLLKTADAGGVSNSTPNALITRVTVSQTSVLSTLDLVMDDGTKGLVLKDTQGTPHYWRVTVSNIGTLVITDIGTTAP